MLNELDQERVKKAIENIFKEAGHKVISISDDGTIIVNIRGEERQYKYKVKVEEDTVTIINKRGIIIAEHFISSYQKPFSFTIDK